MAYYVDTSAFVRLLDTADSSHPAVVAYFDEHDVWSQAYSSDLLRIETMRVAIRENSEPLRRAAGAMLADMQLFDVSREVCDIAAAIPVHVKSLDAIHIATVVTRGPDAVITYDENMIAVLTEHYGIRCVSP